MSLWMMAYIFMSAVTIVVTLVIWASDCKWYEDRIYDAENRIDVKQQFLEKAEWELLEADKENKQLQSQIDDLQQKLKKIAYPSAETLQ